MFQGPSVPRSVRPPVNARKPALGLHSLTHCYPHKHNPPVFQRRGARALVAAVHALSLEPPSNERGEFARPAVQPVVPDWMASALPSIEQDWAAEQ